MERRDLSESRSGWSHKGSPQHPRLPLIGAQVSTAGGFSAVSERAAALGAEVVQIFSSNPRTWQIRSLGREEMDILVEGLSTHGLPLFFHTIYLINLASPDAALRRRSADALAHALALGALARAAGVVTHIGSHKGSGFDRGRQYVVETIREAMETAANQLPLDNRERKVPPLLLETAAGAGAIVGAHLEELAALLSAFDSETPTLGVCLDTAHLFAAGYPVHSTAGLDSVIDLLTSLGLLTTVRLVHLNDSAAPFASNRDKHENPGEGQIGYESLARIVRHPAFAKIPFVLEVPGAEGHGPDGANIAVVKAMRAGRSAATARRAAARTGVTRGPAERYR